MSPKRRKKPPRPKTNAARSRARRAAKSAGRKALPKRGAAKRTAKPGSRASRKAAARGAAGPRKTIVASRPGVSTRKTPARKTAVSRSPKSPPAARKAAVRARKLAGPVALRAKLRVVRSRPTRPAPAPRPFAGAIAGATPKDLAIFDLVRARVEVQAAIQGLQSGTAEMPVAEGKWNPRQILLHLHYWDREMLPFIERAWLHDERPPHTHDQILAENDTLPGELGHHDWDEARRLMQHSREALLEALQSVPEEPAEMWSSEHALGWLIRILSHHDRHHAAVIKQARSRGASSGTESSS
jgi:DinB superfamily